MMLSAFWSNTGIGIENSEPDGVVVGIVEVAPAAINARALDGFQPRNEEFGIALRGYSSPAQ